MKKLILRNWFVQYHAVLQNNYWELFQQSENSTLLHQITKDEEDKSKRMAAEHTMKKTIESL